jgi:hypothetical protein
MLKLMWRDQEMTFEGAGTAEFENPPRSAEGHATIKIDPLGSLRVTMDVAQGGIQSNSQRCIRLSVTAETGTFDFQIPSSIQNFVDRSIQYEFYPLLRFPEGVTDRRITFHPQFAEFSASTSEPPACWVFPLVNFVHPYFDEGGKRIRFTFNNRSAYIRRLPDYAERAEYLKSCHQRRVTALMIGRSPDSFLNFEDIHQWIPLDFLHMLSLSCGTLVGIPWYELRSASGSLIKRIHKPEWQYDYFSGRAILPRRDEISSLLSSRRAIEKAELRTALQTALRLTVKAGNQGETLNETMLFIFLALETLTKQQRQVKRTVNLNDRLKGQVEEILKDARDKLNELKAQADKSQKTILDGIASQVKQKTSKLGDFGEAVAALLEKHSLSVHGVAPEDMEQWKQDVNRYRAQMVHESFFNLTKDVDSPQKIVDSPQKIMKLTNQLHDVLVEILLTMLNYQGEYCSGIYELNVSTI